MLNCKHVLKPGEVVEVVATLPPKCTFCEIEDLQAALEAADALADIMLEACPLTWAAGTSMEEHAYAWEKEAKPLLDTFHALRAKAKK